MMIIVADRYLAFDEITKANVLCHETIAYAKCSHQERLATRSEILVASFAMRAGGCAGRQPHPLFYFACSNSTAFFGSDYITAGFRCRSHSRSASHPQ
jgi:hypothetical protein